ncbi:MAG: Ig-like domain-containing protein [Ginsengibacter sp.]
MKFKFYPTILLLAALFSLSQLKVTAQTDCTSGNNALCVDAITDLCASFTGNDVTSISGSNPSFTGTAISTTTTLSLTTRSYSITANGCVVIRFDLASTGTISSTNVSITTNTGATLNCNNVTIDGSGHACVRICDPRLSQGVVIKLTLDVNSSTNFTTGQTVTLSNFGGAGISVCSSANQFPCPTNFVPLPNDCGASCNPSFPISSGKLRIYFASPIPIGQATPVVTAVVAVNGSAPAGTYVFCLNADAGTGVERTFADYCVYTNVGNPIPLLNTLGTLSLTLQSGSFSQTCLLNACISAGFALQGSSDCPSTSSCGGVTGTLAGKVRIFFVTPIPIGIATPIITDASTGGITLAGYQFCLNADAGITVVRPYADYCIYSTLSATTFPSDGPVTFNSVSGNICAVPIPVPCASDFLVLNNGGALGGSEVACPPAPLTCGPTLTNVVSRVRVYFTPCIPAGIPAPSISVVEGLDASGADVTPLTGRFCFVTTAEADALIATTRCHIDYCVYGAAGDTYFNNADAKIRLIATYTVSEGGVPVSITESCIAVGPPAALPVYNPDVNVTTVNVSVSGNVSTNDVVSGATYGTPQPSGSNPAGATITMNANGSYTFNAATTAGVYVYRVPVCSGAVLPCPTTELKITVLDNTATTNPPVANTDLAETFGGIPVTVRVTANDNCSNPACTLNTGTGLTITTQPANGTATVIGNSIVYMPSPGFLGLDSLTYQICDNSTPTPLCATAIVYITVLDINGANTTSATDDYVATAPGVAVSGNVSTNDMDPVENGQTVTPQNITVASGTLVLNADGTFTFTPAVGFTGPVGFVYTTCDLQAPVACANATLHILVTPLAVSSALPVTLTEFRGVVNNKQVVLNWRTSQEINSSRFDVEHSTNVVSFDNIGTVAAHGNSSVASNYQLIDRSPATGNNYYRLKSVDIDGKFVYSSVIKVNVGDRVNSLITINPNPTHGAIKMSFNGLENGVYSIVLINQIGQVQLTDKITISQSTEQRTIQPQSHLAKGIYMLHVYKDGGTRIGSKKVVVD